MSSVEDLIKTVLDELREIVKTETVVGEPISAGEAIIVPVSKISFGFAAGGAGQSAEKTGKGSGTGGGATVEPIAFVVVVGGKVQIVPLEKRDTGLWKVLELVPEALGKIKDFKGKREKKREKQDAEGPEGSKE